MHAAAPNVKLGADTYIHENPTASPCTFGHPASGRVPERAKRAHAAYASAPNLKLGAEAYTPPSLIWSKRHLIRSRVLKRIVRRDSEVRPGTQSEDGCRGVPFSDFKANRDDIENDGTAARGICLAKLHDVAGKNAVGNELGRAWHPGRGCDRSSTTASQGCRGSSWGRNP